MKKKPVFEEVNVNKINRSTVNQPDHSKDISFHEVVEKQLRPNLIKADQSAEFINQIIRSLISSKGLPSTEELKILYGVCLPLGFTLGQHISAFERLQNYEDWQQSNKELWESICQGRTLVGLATTHLASPNKHMLYGKLVDDDIIINGCIPWATGHRLYDKLIIGLRTDEEIVFAMIDFPKENTSNLKITRHNLQVLNSTDSIRIELTHFKLTKESVLARRPIGAAANVKPVKYWRPEIGIAKECLNKVDQWLESTKHPKADVVRKKAADLKAQYDSIEQIERSLAAERDSDEVNMKRENLIHASLRLLILAKGSSVMALNSEILLLQNQITLMDVWIQNPELINLKIESLGRNN